MKLPARTGWLWLKEGFGLFRIQPGVLMMLLVTNLMFSLLITAVPIIGGLIAVLLIPSLSMALLQACNQIDHGQRVSLPVLLTGFRQPAFVSLCKLGVVYLVALLLLNLLSHALIDPQSVRQLAAPVDPANPQLPDAGQMLNLMLISVLQGVVMILLSFSAPLAFWQNMPALKATFYSVFGVLGARGAFAIMLLAWVGIFLAAALVVGAVTGGVSTTVRVLFMWIFLLFVLVLQCAIYCAYRQLFGAPDLAADKAG